MILNQPFCSRVTKTSFKAVPSFFCRSKACDCGLTKINPIKRTLSFLNITLLAQIIDEENEHLSFADGVNEPVEWYTFFVTLYGRPRTLSPVIPQSSVVNNALFRCVDELVLLWCSLVNFNDQTTRQITSISSPTWAGYSKAAGGGPSFAGETGGTCRRPPELHWLG